MILGICSDVHANLPALESVVRDMKREGVAQKYCLGDIVGYNAQPNETIKLLLKEGFKSIRGNHDQYVLEAAQAPAHERIATLAKIDNQYGVSGRALGAIGWAADHVSDESIAFLHTLEYRIDVPVGDYTLQLTHAGPDAAPESWSYMNTENSVARAFEILPEKTISMFGHLHIPYALFQHKKKWAINEARGEVELPVNAKKFPRVIVNVGSVGQPRDNDKRACWVSYDTEKNTLAFHRSFYKVATTRRFLQNAGYDRDGALGARLMFGR